MNRITRKQFLKRGALSIIGALFGGFAARAQKDKAPVVPQPAHLEGDIPAILLANAYIMTPEERALRKNLVVTERNTDARGKRQWLDHITVWDEDGYKTEETEFGVYGVQNRITYKYDKTTGKITEESRYNDKGKLVHRSRYEYYDNLRKKIKYNYEPNGKLFTTKVYEYTYADK